MRLAWLTDIHLDHARPETVEALAHDVAARGVDGVVLTGDLSHAAQLDADLARLVEPWHVPTWLVLGNHDYWGSSTRVVREQMAQLPDGGPLRWLPREGAVLLDEDTALVGVDGWADARHGDVEGSTVRMRDYAQIEDLVHDELAQALEVARALADTDADRLRALLGEALEQRAHVIVATHIPPFPEAARFNGVVTHPHWLPWLTCRAVGDALVEAADRHPDRRLTVLCGHMHHPADVMIRGNLRVRCGAAKYGAPAVQDVLDTQAG